MSAQSSPLERRPSRKRSFVKKIIPKFLRRSRKHSSGNQERHSRSFVVEDDNSSGDNWDERDDVFDISVPTIHQDRKMLRVHISPTTCLNRMEQQRDHTAANKIDDMATNTEEIATSPQNSVQDQKKRLEPQTKPKCLIPTAPVLEEVSVESTFGQAQGETHLTSGQSQGESHLTSQRGQDEYQGQSIVGTIQVKLAPDDFDTGGDYANLLRTLAPNKTAEETNSNSGGIYDFPMFGDESLIRNHEFSVDSLGSHDHVTPERTRKNRDIKPLVMAWGMVVLSEPADDFAPDRSRIEDMLLSSSMDDALKYRYSVEENGWGMVYTPDNLSVNWSINPIKDIFGAFWDLLSVILVSSVFLITGTAVSIVTVWQTAFMAINAILSVSKWASSVRQGNKRTRPYMAPIRLPSSVALEVKNPFKKVCEVLLKPLGALFVIFLAPLVIIDRLVQKAKRRTVTANRFRPMNIFSRMMNWTRKGGKTSAPVRMRIGSVWGSHSGGSRSCNCKCRDKCTIS